MERERDDRAQSGLDRLLLFVIAVVVVVLLAPHVLGFAGIDVGAEQTPSQTGETDHDLIVLEARGTAIEGSTIGAVRLIVTPSPNRDPVDLAEGSTIWVGDRSYHLTPAESVGEDFDGAYRAGVLESEGTRLEEARDRGELLFDLGETDDVSGIPEFGTRLEPGQRVSITLVTPHGETLTRQLEVPESISGDSVAL
jgi:archaellin